MKEIIDGLGFIKISTFKRWYEENKIKKSSRGSRSVEALEISPVF